MNITTKSQVISNINFKKIALEQGLSSINVRNLIEDKNGFIWFSTQDGLNKYDGNKITQFNSTNKKPTSKQLLGSDCFAMSYIQNEDYLYVLSAYEGLNIIDVNTNTVVNKIPFQKLIKSDTALWLKRMIRYKNYIIISTPTKLIWFDLKNNKTEKVINVSLKESNTIEQIDISDTFILLLLSNGNIVSINLNNPTQKFDDLYINSNRNLNINNIEVHSQNLWLCTNMGLKVMNLKSRQMQNMQDVFSNCNIKFYNLRPIAIEITDSLFCAINNEGVFTFDFVKKKCTKLELHLDDESKMFLKFVNTIKFVNDGIYFCGSYGAAFVSKKKYCFSNIYKSNNIKLSHVFSLHKDYISNDLFVSAEDGFYKVNHNSDKIDKLYSDLIVLGNLPLKNTVLFSCQDKMRVFTKNKIYNVSDIYSELKVIENDWFDIIKQINTTQILFASHNKKGLYLWDLINHRVQKFDNNTKPSIKDVMINNIFIINSNEVLIISETEIYKFIISTKSITSVFSKLDLVQNNVGVFMDITKQNSNYYIGTYGLGLIKLDSDFKFKELISSLQGFNNIGIYKVFSFNDSLVLATTNNGLSIFDTKLGTVKNYFENDGLHSNAFEETSGEIYGDTIIAGGLNGFTIFNTKNYTANSIAPKLFFDEINIESPNGRLDNTNILLQSLSIPNNYTQVKISFVGLNYTNPTRVNYWYRIKEIGEVWIDLKNQNFIDLIGIPPGKYTLEVKAANEDGVECAPIKMTLHFLPKWYQTLLFKILLGLAIASLLFILYTFRIRQLKKVIAVRQKISQNLHDDIGSTLSAINMYTQVAKLQPQQNDFLNNIEENTQDVLSKLDDIIWSTNPKNDKFSNLVDRMETFAFPLCKANGVKFLFNTDELLLSNKISEAIRQNLFFIFKEALNNALKYANCSNIEVQLSTKNKILTCSITDNGKGFNTSVPTQRNGLLNMQLRAKEINGSCHITSNVGEGTTVLVQIPL